MKNVETYFEDLGDYKIGNLMMTVQGIPGKDGVITKGVFCTLYIKKDEEGAEEEKIDFVFSLTSVPEFNRHVQSLIKQAIKLKEKDNKKTKKNKKDENKG